MITINDKPCQKAIKLIDTVKEVSLRARVNCLENFTIWFAPYIDTMIMDSLNFNAAADQDWFNEYTRQQYAKDTRDFYPEKSAIIKEICKIVYEKMRA
jgi:hypothetical protein